jgi:hypothetical protein
MPRDRHSKRSNAGEYVARPLSGGTKLLIALACR